MKPPANEGASRDMVKIIMGKFSNRFESGNFAFGSLTNIFLGN